MDEQLLHDAHAVFCEVFQSDMPYETFRHKHMDNPNIDRSVMTLVDYQNGAAAGTNSFMGYVLLDGHQSLPVVHSCDSAVKSAFRGRRIFSSLIERAINTCQESQNAFIYATPNPNSYPGFVKLNFCELGKLETYTTITRPVHLLARKLLRKASDLSAFQDASFTDHAGRSWKMSLKCPFTGQDIAAINNHSGIHLQRSRDFFQWKIDYLPEGEAAYLCVWQGDALSAYFVLRRHINGSCEFCDWMVPKDRTASLQILKTAVHFLRSFCDLLSVPMVNPESDEPTLLTGSGFFRKKSWPLPFMIYPTSSLDEDELNRLKNLRNWSLRSIDFDTILNG